jgi:ABC-type lipoprotein release transport system permease subunit
LPVEQFSANGEQCLNCLCQPRGQAHLGAYALGGLLSKLIYGVSPTDPLTFLVVVLLLMAVALGACAVPAYRATRIQPVQALRGE